MSESCRRKVGHENVAKRREASAGLEERDDVTSMSHRGRGDVTSMIEDVTSMTHRGRGDVTSMLEEADDVTSMSRGGCLHEQRKITSL